MIKLGTVVIVETGQAGTVWLIEGQEVVIGLANGDLYYGYLNQLRIPNNREELKACPKDLPHFSNRNGSYTRKPA